MGSNCTRVNIQTTLFTKGSIAHNDRVFDLKSGQIGVNDFFGVR